MFILGLVYTGTFCQMFAYFGLENMYKGKIDNRSVIFYTIINICCGKAEKIKCL